MQYSITDTGTTALLIAEPYFLAYLDKLFEAAKVDEYEIIDGYAYSPCFGADNHPFPSLLFQFDNYWFEIFPEHYLADTSDARDLSLCKVGIGSNSVPFNVFGSPFFKGYYVSHLVEEKVLRIVPGKGSRKGPIQYSEIPNQILDGLDIKSKVWISLISVVVAAGISLFYAFYLLEQITKCFPDKVWVVVLISLAYFIPLICGYIFGILPLLVQAFSKISGF
jgi:hypothetical protein